MNCCLSFHELQRCCDIPKRWAIEEFQRFLYNDAATLVIFHDLGSTGASNVRGKLS